MMMGMMALMTVTDAGTMEVEIVDAARESQSTDCSRLARPVARLSDCAVRITIAAHAPILRLHRPCNSAATATAEAGNKDDARERGGGGERG